jgi:hypothetical protein
MRRRAEVLLEIRRMREELVPAREFGDAQRSLAAGFVLSIESPGATLLHHLTRWLYRLPADYWDEYPERITRVTSRQVQDVARRYLEPSRLQIVAVGDKNRIGSVLQDFGPVTHYDAAETSASASPPVQPIIDATAVTTAPGPIGTPQRRSTRRRHTSLDRCTNRLLTPDVVSGSACVRVGPGAPTWEGCCPGPSP